MSTSISIIIVSAVILLGIVLLLVELFLLPGITIAGIAGSLVLIGGVIYAYAHLGNTGGNITLATTAAVLTVSFVWLVKSKSLRKIALKTEITESVDNADLKKIKPGDIGISLSRLNPIGKVMINDIILEGKSMDGELIDEDIEIEVMKVESNNVAVIKRQNS